MHYENIKAAAAHDYDWILQTNWLATTTPLRLPVHHALSRLLTSARESINRWRQSGAGD